MSSGFLARRLEQTVVAFTELGKHSEPALPGPGHFGLFTFEMKILRDIIDDLRFYFSTKISQFCWELGHDIFFLASHQDQQKLQNNRGWAPHKVPTKLHKASDLANRLSTPQSSHLENGTMKLTCFTGLLSQQTFPFIMDALLFFHSLQFVNFQSQ